jgi:hypothetical protein
MNGTHYLVKYGPKREYRAYFDDRAKAEQYVVSHENAVIEQLHCDGSVRAAFEAGLREHYPDANRMEFLWQFLNACWQRGVPQMRLTFDADKDLRDQIDALFARGMDAFIQEQTNGSAATPVAVAPARAGGD